MIDRHSLTLILFGGLFALAPLYGNAYLFPDPASGNPMLAISLVASLVVAITVGIQDKIIGMRFALLIYFFFGFCLSLTVVGFFHNSSGAAVGQVLLGILAYIFMRTAKPLSYEDELKARSARVLN